MSQNKDNVTKVEKTEKTEKVKKKKVKNVIKGLLSTYDLEEISIIQLSENKVIYTGSADGWIVTDVDMILYKRQIENMEVVNQIIFNHRKAFIFI